MKEENKVKWYDNARTITTFIIFTILVIIVCSQSIVVGDGSFRILSSIINHNTSYLLLLIYFISIKTYFGKRYFNYFNVFIIFIYFILTFTSFLTIIQSFSFNTIVEFLINIIILIYLSHTMFRDTRVWKDLKLGNSPFNEIPNDYYFSTLLILVTFSLIINLISTVILRGMIVSILDAIYVGLLARYIYLYRDYLDKNKIDVDNNGSFDTIKKEISENVDEIKETISNVADSVKDKTDEVVDKYDLDEKVDAVKSKIVDVGNDISDKVNDVVDDFKLDEKASVQDNNDKQNEKKRTTTKKNIKKKSNTTKKKGDK